MKKCPMEMSNLKQNSGLFKTRKLTAQIFKKNRNSSSQPRTSLEKIVMLILISQNKSPDLSRIKYSPDYGNDMDKMS